MENDLSEQQKIMMKINLLTQNLLFSFNNLRTETKSTA